MITRRSVRIKAMQYIYAYEIALQDTQIIVENKRGEATGNKPALNTSPSYYEAQLEKSILSVKEQYLYLLLNLREISNFVETDAKIKASKYIKNEKDKNFNTKLLSNVIVQYLNNNKEFEDEI